MNRRIKVYGTLVLVTFLSWGIVQLNQPEPTIERKKPAHNPDFFSTGYSKIELDQQGHRKNELIAEKLTHYHDDDTTELLHPEMRIFNADQLAWAIKADLGKLSADGDNLVLQGNVRIARGQVQEAREIIVRTSNLRVKTSQKYAETDDWVEIAMPPDVTEGVGMQMYFTKPIHLKLLSKVKGKYELH